MSAAHFKFAMALLAAGCSRGAAPGAVAPSQSATKPVEVEPNPNGVTGTAPPGTTSPDVTELGSAAPAPGRAIEPSRVAGRIKVAPALQARAVAGGLVLISVRRSDAAGMPSGPALAAQRLSWDAESLAFELTERDAMLAGIELTGDVVLVVRYDQDGDAATRQPGDLVGQVRVTIPADKVEVVLDRALP